MIRLWIENEQEKEDISEEVKKLVKRAIEHSLEFEECDFDAEVSVTFVDNEEIRVINRENRDIDKATDVLSFPMLEFDENGDIIDSEYDMNEEYLMLGDIVISAERAREQSIEYGHSFEREIAFLTVHSMLHLLGYDHVNSEEEEKIMFDKQEKILTELGITR